MAPVTQPVPIKGPASELSRAAQPGSGPGARRAESPSPAQLASIQDEDGTRQLLKWGGWTLVAGIVCALATKFLFGGIGPQGPHTNSGWMALIVAMMCLPFGFLLFLLGTLKWLRNRRERRA